MEKAFFKIAEALPPYFKGLFGLFALIAAIAIADIVAPPPLEKAQIVSPLAVDHEGRWLHAFTTPQGRWRFKADLENIDPDFIERLITIEDKRFYSHLGVDLTALARACIDAIRYGRITSGASTITMQTARLLEPRERTLSSKVLEMLRALQIERRLSKREILELYLTLAPYGGNLEGLRAASLSYFDVEPIGLSPAQQALLIALPQAPEARRPDRRPEAAKAARGVILNKLENNGVLTANIAREAGEEPLPPNRTPFPRIAYHTAWELTRDGDDLVRTSLDLFLQQKAERLVSSYGEGVSDGANISLLIVDHQSMAVRAAVGSKGVKTQGGWINLTRAVRSPGSTLKPFIYGLAFDDGIAAPETLISDRPQRFGGYTPENFDRTFRGEVRIKEALQHSLNLPAVAALEQLGAPRFANLLIAAGANMKTAQTKSMEESAGPGLALALGGAGLTARDLAMLYAGLANGGAVRPLNWLYSDNQEKADASYRLLSAQSAEKVGDILRNVPSLKGRAPAMLISDAPQPAFKTGTSYGYRDAWAAGYAGRYTVVVWVGRADGAPRPGETGRKAAAPLLFDVFDALAKLDQNDTPNNTAPQPEPAPMALRRFAPKKEASPPQILFPPNGSTLYADFSSQERGVAMTASGGAKNYQWYVDGDLVDIDKLNIEGRAIWRPASPGFYDITVVDGDGRSGRAKVQVLPAL